MSFNKIIICISLSFLMCCQNVFAVSLGYANVRNIENRTQKFINLYISLDTNCIRSGLNEEGTDCYYIYDGLNYYFDNYNFYYNLIMYEGSEGESNVTMANKIKNYLLDGYVVLADVSDLDDDSEANDGYLHTIPIFGYSEGSSAYMLQDGFNRRTENYNASLIVFEHYIYMR